MNTGANNKSCCASRLGLVSAAIFGLIGTSHAQQWEWEVTADISVVHTDNLTLEAENLEESETVYLIAPTFVIRTENERTSADIRYRPEAYLYNERSDADEVFHIIDAQLETALVENALYFAASAARYQTIEGPDSAFPTSNLPVLGSRVDSEYWEVRPYWNQRLGVADILLELSHFETSYDELPASALDLNRDNEINSGVLQVNNYSNQEGLAWGFDYSYVRIEYDQSVPWDQQHAILSLGFWPNETLRLFASGGPESSYEDIFDPALADESWEVGFQYAPNSRMNMEIAAGERSFGSSVRADLSYRLRRGTLTFSYSEDPSSRALIGDDRRPILTADNLDTFLDRPGRADRFVRRRGELEADIELAKSELIVRLFFEERDQRTSDVGDSLSDERFAGAALRWVWQVGAKSDLSIGGDFAHREEPGSVPEIESDLIRVGAEYGYQFAQRLRISARVQRSEEDAIQGGSIRDYVENQFWLTLTVGD